MQPCSIKQIIMIIEYIFTIGVFIYLLYTRISSTLELVVVGTIGTILISGILYYMINGQIIDPVDPIVDQLRYIEKTDDDCSKYSKRDFTKQKVQIDNEKLFEFYCSICNSYVGSKSKHCGSCNKCVSEFDHHCEWLNNCVGQQNFREFLGLVVIYNLQTIFQIILVGIYCRGPLMIAFLVFYSVKLIILGKLMLE
mgnify:CR=1 FL=1